MKKVLTTISGLLFGMIFTLAMAQEAPNTQTEEAAEDTRLGVVLDLERPSNTDILLLRNGDKLTGTIQNESFAIRTSYANLKFNNRMIAGIDLEGGANNIESIITVNNNRFSGFINDPVFVFKLQTGTQIQVRREKVLKAVFRVRDAERRGIPQRQFVVLKNGDFFSGKIKNEKFTIATTYAKLPVKLAEAESITLIGGANPLTKVMLRNGDQLQGVLETEDVELALDVGADVKIYKDRMDVIYCKEGFIPNLAYLGSARAAGSRGRVIKISNTVDGFSSAFISEGLRIKSISESSTYHGYLQPGDIIKTIGGDKYRRGLFTKARQTLLSGQASKVVIGVQRGNSTIHFTLVKQ